MGRKRKYTNSSVISIRISDDELATLNAIMAKSRITRVSDLMREAIGIFKSSLPLERQRLGSHANRVYCGERT
jgi:hypothetical protein